VRASTFSSSLLWLPAKCQQGMWKSISANNLCKLINDHEAKVVSVYFDSKGEN
jgi:hypothetical protein